MKDRTVGEWVAEDFRSASIFKDAGIDFCCGGDKNVTDACNEKNIDPLDIEEKLVALENQAHAQALDFKNWPISFLCDYIVNIHHSYVKKNLPDLKFYTQKIADVHSEHHPELINVASLFSKLFTELSEHLQNEEEKLFPAVKNIQPDSADNQTAFFNSELEHLISEHESAGEILHQIQKLTGNYLIPDDACNTYRLTMNLLSEFEDDLHVHIHLENNILFPALRKLTFQD